MSLFSRIKSAFSKPVSFISTPTVYEADTTLTSPPYSLANTSTAMQGTPTISAALPLSMPTVEDFSACLEAQNRRYDHELTI